MRENSRKIAERGQHNEGTNESRECSRRSYIDAAHDGSEHATEDNRAKWIVATVIDVGEEVAERGCVVPCQRPENPACRDITSYT